MSERTPLFKGKAEQMILLSVVVVTAAVVAVHAYFWGL